MPQDKFQREIEDAKVEGWELKDETNDRAVLIRRKTGTLVAHIVLFIVAGWWTLGIANLIYLGYKYFADVDKKVIRREDVE